MRARFFVAYGALALAIALLAPAIVPLSGSMDAFASDLANGSFRPFGQLGGGTGGGQDFSGSLGGFTGDSPGNYLPGAGDVPRSWPMDRDGSGGTVTIDYVFNPALGAMKRLKTYDRLASDGVTLTTNDLTLRPLTVDPSLRYDRIIEGSYRVAFDRDQPVPIFSPHPKAIIDRATVEPALSGGVQFFKDGADTFYALGHEDRVATLNITFRVSADYYVFDPPENVRVLDYRYSPSLPRPVVPDGVRADAGLVLARAGVDDPTDVGATLDALAGYFRSFTEGPIPPPNEIESLYLALALGEKGCCRHRAFAFMVTAQAVGIPTRVVVNEAHAFVEVAMPDGKWHQINLGGCGSYNVNNPNEYPSLFDQASSPRTEANPDEGQPVARIPTFTNITEAPSRIVKGQRYFVNGTVLTSDGRGVFGARVDVFLNETKDTPGRRTGASTTRADGTFSVVALVPAQLPARPYQLVARASDGQATAARFAQSWSDPEVDVFAPTRFAFAPPVAAAGFPANLSGRLVDVDGAGVPNATIRWSSDGAAQPSVISDGAGRFVLRALFNSTGAHVVTVRFEGSSYHGPAVGDLQVNVTRGAIILPADAPALVRGQENRITGQVVIAGADASGRDVQFQAIAPLLVGRGVSGADGAFAITVTPGGGETPGPRNASYRVPSLDLTVESVARVVAASALTLRAPTDARPGAPLVIEAEVRLDNGTEVPGAIVELSLGAQRNVLLTNRTGVARFEVDAPTDERAYALRVSFPGDATSAAAVATSTLTVAKSWYERVPLWAYAGVGALVLLAGLVASLASTDGRARRALRAGLARASRPERRFLAIAFPDHPPGVPAVFEPGERARVRVVVRDADGRALDARIGLHAADAHVAAQAKGEAGALFDVVAPTRGPLTLRAHATGLARVVTKPLSASVPIASYRQAVELAFVKLRERAGFDAATTPGDLVATLGPRLEPHARDALRRAATMFELADYSEAAIDRRFYHDFAANASAVRQRLDGDPRAG